MQFLVPRSLCWVLVHGTVSSMQGDTIRSTVEALLKALGANIEGIHISETPRLTIAVSSPDSKMLIGQQGETLQALNVIVRRLIEAKADDPAAVPNFLIDINGYHEAKLEELRSSARVLADRARMFKHEVDLPPMTSYERLVIHEMFANDPEIETVSSGEGKFRHIVLRYKDKNQSDGEIL